jgi:hypothetical protein
MSRRFLSLLKFPWRNDHDDSWSVRLIWRAAHFAILFCVVFYAWSEPWQVLLKHGLAAQGAFLFAAFFLADWPRLRYPKSLLELSITRVAALLCLLLLMQASFKFAGAQWLGTVAGAMILQRSLHWYIPSVAALLSFVAGGALYRLMWKSSRGFKTSASIFFRHER